MHGNWDCPQGAPMMIPPSGIGHGCVIPSNMACDEACNLPMAKPIRVFQFLLVTLLFSMTIFTISKNSPYQQVEAILLTVLFGSFLFIELVDIISQCGGDPIPDTPMFLFGVVGTLLFIISAGGIFFVTRRDGVEEAWRLTVSMALAAACSLLFLLDVLLIFLYGKTRMGDKSYESLGGKHRSETLRWKDTCTPRLCRPLRIFQFLTILLLFAIIVYMIAMPKNPSRPLTDLASILLIVLTSSYLFFIAIDLISQFGTHGLPDSPMFLLSFLGMLFFATAGGLMMHYEAMDNNFWALVLARILCFVVSALFLIEITILLAYWRQRCLNWKKCYPYIPAGSCGHREMRTLFLRAGPHDPDIEIGRRDLATSMSQCGIPLETCLDNAVLQHACRKINVGHRRQYVDRHSSIPALPIYKMAQIQTENGTTAISESQTHRTELMESVAQTVSKCELCHRQMIDGLIRPIQYSPLSSPVLRGGQYQSSRGPEVAAMPSENTQYNHPQIPISSDSRQSGNCAVCPAMFNMMRGGINGPCCQSCNCGANAQSRPPVPFLLDQKFPRQGALIHSPDRSERNGHQTPGSTSTMKPYGSESPTTTAEKSDAEHVDLMIEEGNKNKPDEKLAPVYETRPCPTHGAGIATNMAELPESASKIALSSISVRRNKRTQTPSKKNDSSASKDIEKNEGGDKIFDSKNNRRKEDMTNGLKNQDKSRDNEIEAIVNYRSESFEKIHDVSKIEEIIERSSDERVKKMSQVEIQTRLSEERKNNYSSPKKLYRDDKIEVKSNEPTISPVLAEVSDRDSENVKNRSMKLAASGQMIWKSESTEIQESKMIDRIDDWPAKEFRTKEDADSEIDVEKMKNKIKLEKMIVKNEPGIVAESREREIDENVSMIGSRKSSDGSGPILRLRMEELAEDLRFTEPEAEKSDDGISSSQNPESRWNLGSRSKGSTGQFSKKNLETSSEDQKDSSEMALTRQKTDATKTIKSPESKKSLVFHERSSNIKRAIFESHPDRPNEEERPMNEELPERLKEEEIKEYEIWEKDRADAGEGIDEKLNSGMKKRFSTSSKISRTKLTVHDDEDNKIWTGKSKSDLSKIISSPEPKISFTSPERSGKIEGAISKSRSDDPGEETTKFIEKEIPIKLKDGEISDYEISGKDDGSEIEEKSKILTSGVKKPFVTSSRASRTRSIYRNGDEDSKLPIEKLKNDGSKIIQSPESKKSPISEGSVKMETGISDFHSDRSDEDGPTRLKEKEISDRDEEGEIDEEIKKSSSGIKKEFSRSNRVTRIRSNVRDNKIDGNKILTSPGSDGGKIIRSPGSKQSLVSDRPDEEKPTRLKEEEMSEKEIFEENDEGVIDEKLKKSISGVENKFSRSSEVTRTRSTVQSNVDKKIENEKSLSYSDEPKKHKESIDDETPTRLTEEEKSEYETAQRDEEEEIVKKLRSFVPKEFARSTKISRTKPNVVGKNESKGIIDERDLPLTRKSAKKISQQLEKEKSSILSGPRSRGETNVILAPKRETRRNESAIAYARASWSPNVFQRTKRIESIQQGERSQMSGDAYVGSGRPSRPSGQCMENSACQQPSGFFAEEHDSVPRACTKDTGCIESCSCRIKSTLMEQRSPGRQCVHYNHAERVAIVPRHLRYENEKSHGECPGRQLRCRQEMSSWSYPRQQPKCCHTPTRSTNNYENITRPRRTSNNFCFIS